MLHTSLRQFLGKSKEHDLLWNWLHCNKPSITSEENSGKEFCNFLHVPDESHRSQIWFCYWFVWNILPPMPDFNEVVVFYALFLPWLGYTWWINEEERISYCFSLKCIIQNSCWYFWWMSIKYLLLWLQPIFNLNCMMTSKIALKNH